MKYFKNKETKKFLGFFMALAMIVSMMPGVASAKVVELSGKVTTTVVTDAAITIDTVDVNLDAVTPAAIKDVMAVDVTTTCSALAGAVTKAAITIALKNGYAVSGDSLKVNGEKKELNKEITTEISNGKATFSISCIIVKKATGTIGGSTSSAAPSAKPSATPSVAPSASAAPTASVAPTKAPTESAAPTKAPTESAAPTKAPAKKTVKVGTKKTVNGGKYKVTKGNTVTYTAPSKKTAKVTIPATVKINGVTCKVTTIGKGAFKGNTKIKTVSLGKNIKKIEANAFKGCKNLKSITIKSTSLTKKNVAKTAFKGINKKATFKVPAKKVKAYKAVVKYAGAPKTVKVKK